MDDLEYEFDEESGDESEEEIATIINCSDKKMKDFEFSINYRNQKFKICATETTTVDELISNIKETLMDLDLLTHIDIFNLKYTNKNGMTEELTTKDMSLNLHEINAPHNCPLNLDITKRTYAQLSMRARVDVLVYLKKIDPQITGLPTIIAKIFDTLTAENISDTTVAKDLLALSHLELAEILSTDDVIQAISLLRLYSQNLIYNAALKNINQSNTNFQQAEEDIHTEAQARLIQTALDFNMTPEEYAEQQEEYARRVNAATAARRG